MRQCQQSIPQTTKVLPDSFKNGLCWRVLRFRGYRMRACSPKCSPFPIRRIGFWCPLMFLVTRTCRREEPRRGREDESGFLECVQEVGGVSPLP